MRNIWYIWDIWDMVTKLAETTCRVLLTWVLLSPRGGGGGQQRHVEGVVARCGTFLMFLQILPGEEAHRKPLWRVFLNACGWSPEAFG